jgi:hypothetical protein
MCTYEKRYCTITVATGFSSGATNAVKNMTVAAQRNVRKKCMEMLFHKKKTGLLLATAGNTGKTWH